MKAVITEIIGPIVDVHFKESRPAIGDALIIEKTDTHGRLTLEVASLTPAGPMTGEASRSRCPPLTTFQVFPT